MSKHAKPSAPRDTQLGWMLAAAVVAVAIVTTTVVVVVKPRQSSPTSTTTVSVLGTSATTESEPSITGSPSNTGSSVTAAQGGQPTAADPTPLTTAATAPVCPDLIPLRVATTTALAAPLREVAEDSCVDLEVVEVERTDGAALLTAGEVDVWMPDSRQHGVAAGEQVWSAPAMSWSPVVLSAAPTTTPQVSSAGPVPWAAVLAGQGTLNGIPVSIDDNSSAVSLAVGGELLTQAVTVTGGDQRLALATTAGALRGLVADDPTLPVAPEGTVRMTELRELGAAEVIPTVEGYPVLEAPWIAADPADPASVLMVDALAGPIGARALAEHGFVQPGGATVTVAAGVGGSPLTEDDPTRTALLWAMTGEGTRPGRTLAVLDVSGSMGEVQPDGRTPMDGLKASVPLLIAGLSGETSVGVWVFGNQLEPPHDWAELVPVAPLAQNLPAIQQAVTDIQPRRTGSSLNSTVLDAYRAMQSSYDPTATNIVGIFTDGRNEDAPGGIDLPTLQAEIAALADPTRPIVLLCFGYGAADTAALQQIVAANSGLGGVWDIDAPEHIVGAMIEATAATLVFG